MRAALAVLAVVVGAVSGPAGWSWIAGSFVLLVAALATVRAGGTARRGSRVRGSPT